MVSPFFDILQQATKVNIFGKDFTDSPTAVKGETLYLPLRKVVAAATPNNLGEMSFETRLLEKGRFGNA
jgi:hypothetical protein